MYKHIRSSTDNIDNSNESHGENKCSIFVRHFLCFHSHGAPQFPAFVKVLDQENSSYRHDYEANKSGNRKRYHEGENIPFGVIFSGVVDDQSPIGQRESNHCEAHGKYPWHPTTYLVDDHPCYQAYDGSSCEGML